MPKDEKIGRTIAIRFSLYFIAGGLELIFILFRVGYEGTGNLQGMFFFSLLAYALLGIIVILITAISPSRLLRSYRYDIIVLILITGGLNINKYHLPGFTDPLSILWNVVILVFAIFAGIIVERIIRRSRQIRVMFVTVSLAIIAYVPSLIYVYSVAPLNSAARSQNYPSIIIVTLDTVRANHLGAYGYERDTSPNFDRFAEENTLLTEMRTPLPLTAPSHASLFSGEMPHEHAIFNNITPYPDPPGHAPLAEILSGIGYRTAGFPAAVHLGKQENFDRGFTVFNQSSIRRGPEWVEKYYQLAPVMLLTRLGIFHETFLLRTSGEVTHSFINWYRNNESDGAPVFAWLHYFDAHSPYKPPEEYWRRFDPDYNGPITGDHEQAHYFNTVLDLTDHGDHPPPEYTWDDIENLIARYDGEILHQDENLGELLDFIDSTPALQDAIVVLVSDHGEGLFDDGYFGHNISVKNYEIHLACAIRGPGIDIEPDRQTSNTDITDYILGVTGQRPDLGRLGGVEESEIMEEYGYLDKDPFTSMVFLGAHCWVEVPYKLVRKWEVDEGVGVRYELFNLIDDPGEKVNLYDVEPEIAETMRDSLSLWLDDNQADFPDLLGRVGTIETMNPMILEQLRSLGYIY